MEDRVCPQVEELIFISRTSELKSVEYLYTQSLLQHAAGCCSLVIFKVPMKQFIWLQQQFSTLAKTGVAPTRHMSHDKPIPVLGFSDCPSFLRKRMQVLNPQATNVIYIYIYIYIYMEHLFLMFLDHTQRRTTVGRTPLDE